MPYKEAEQGSDESDARRLPQCTKKGTEEV